MNKKHLYNHLGLTERRMKVYVTIWMDAGIPIVVDTCDTLEQAKENQQKLWDVSTDTEEGEELEQLEWEMVAYGGEYVWKLLTPMEGELYITEYGK